MIDAITSDACPECGTTGRRVAPLTPGSLLSADAKTRLNGATDLRFCKVERCDVAYYGENDGARFAVGDLRVPVFQKSTDPSRLICYCFEHRVADIEEEVARTGASVVPDRITEKCRQGLDRCEELNPQGVCCLGNVRALVKSATANAPPSVGSPAGAGKAVPISCATANAGDESGGDCCDVTDVAKASDPGENLRGRRNIGLWSAAGAIFAAAFASACCWLPLILIGAGASAVGVSGFFEAYRAYFLGGTALLLGAGFYLVYLRKPMCAPGEACEIPNSKLVRLNRTVLWVATVFAVAFAAFPNYVGYLLGGSGGPALAATATLESRAYAIEGMTCEGCTGRVVSAIEGVNGVASVRVSYPDKMARVYMTEGAEVPDAEILEAVEAVGYRAAPHESER